VLAFLVDGSASDHRRTDEVVTLRASTFDPHPSKQRPPAEPSAERRSPPVICTVRTGTAVLATTPRAPCCPSKVIIFIPPRGKRALP
jgi:hypothetical protein